MKLFVEKPIFLRQTRFIICFITLILLYVEDYPPVQFFLNITGRPIVYSAEWALHQLVKGVKVKKNQMQLYNALENVLIL